MLKSLTRQNFKAFIFLNLLFQLFSNLVQFLCQFLKKKKAILRISSCMNFLIKTTLNGIYHNNLYCTLSLVFAFSDPIKKSLSSLNQERFSDRSLIQQPFEYLRGKSVLGKHFTRPNQPCLRFFHNYHNLSSSREDDCRDWSAGRSGDSVSQSRGGVRRSLGTGLSGRH